MVIKCVLAVFIIYSETAVAFNKMRLPVRVSWLWMWTFCYPAWIYPTNKHFLAELWLYT